MTWIQLARQIAARFGRPLRDEAACFPFGSRADIEADLATFFENAA